MKIILTPNDFDRGFENALIYKAECPDCGCEIELTDEYDPFTKNNFTCVCGIEWSLEVKVEIIGKSTTK